MTEVSLDEDIYSIGLLTFLRSDSPKKLDRITQKCVFAFVTQMSLLGLMLVKNSSANWFT